MTHEWYIGQVAQSKINKNKNKNKNRLLTCTAMQIYAMCVINWKYA